MVTASAAREIVEILAQESEYALLMVDGCLVQIWRSNTSLAGVRACRHWVAKRTDIVASLVVVPHGSKAPVSAARAELVELGKELSLRTNALALVIEERGMPGIIKRALMSGLVKVVPGHMPYETFATAGEAIAWLKSRAEGQLWAELASSVATYTQAPGVRRTPVVERMLG